MTFKPFINYLKYLKEKGYKTCLATSTVKEFVDVILKHYGLLEYFDEVLTADDVTKGKPDPQIYNIALKRLMVSKGEAIVFEDSKNGVSSAKNAGIYCIGILTKGLNEDYVYSADSVIENYKDLA